MRSSKPAYAVDAWLTGAPGAGPQCSAGGEFCFFCAFSETTDGGHVKDLKALVALMVGQRKELGVVVNAVQEAYRDNIRPDVVAKGPTGLMLQQPDWSKASISRHLIYSTEFPALFDAVVTQIHQSLIMKLNAAAVTDGEVDMSVTDEIRKLSASLRKWQGR